MTPDEGSWIGSLLPIGALIGAFKAGTLADLIGRKGASMLMVFPQLIAWILIYFAKSVNMLYLGRLIGGLGLGALSCTIPMYVSEIAEDSIRGALGSSFKLMLVSGVLYSFVIGALVHYSLLPVCCGVLNVVFLALFCRAPESPVFLLKKGKTQEAEDALRRLRGRGYNVRKEITLIEKALSEDTSANGSFWKGMAKKEGIHSMTICLGLMFFQQLSGITAVIFYTGSIFRDAGSSLDPPIATMLVGLAQVLSTIVAISLIDRAGRKILLLLSALVMAVCLAVLGYYFHHKTSGSDITSFGTVPLISVVIFILAYAVGFGPIPWMIAGEVLPPEIKAEGTGITSAINWFLVFTVSKSFQPLLDTVGPAVTYWIYSVICILGFFFVQFVVFETKGKTIIEIQEILSHRKRTKKSNGEI